MVSGHTRVPATISFGDVGDAKSPILHDSLSEESDKTETARHDFTSLILKLLIEWGAMIRSKLAASWLRYML